MVVFEHMFLDKFAQKAIRDERGFTSVDTIFNLVNSTFLKRGLQKKVCVTLAFFAHGVTFIRTT